MNKVTKIILAALAFSIVAVGVFGFTQGYRMFIIQTPSMAEYAPVGTAVLSAPVEYGDIETDDMILFKPSGYEDTYFHRVESVTNEGLKTQGDLNGSVDPWVITEENIVGQELLRVQNLGFLLQVLPFFVVGGVVLHFITGKYSKKQYVFPHRVTGWSLLTTTAVLLSKPFFNVQLIEQALAEDNKTSVIKFVATGVFGVQGATFEGAAESSLPGQLVSVSTQHVDAEGFYVVNITPYLQGWDWVILGAYIFAPLLLCSLYALHQRRVIARNKAAEHNHELDSSL